jgi:hypothetical protein
MKSLEEGVIVEIILDRFVDVNKTILYGLSENVRTENEPDHFEGTGQNVSEFLKIEI